MMIIIIISIKILFENKQKNSNSKYKLKTLFSLQVREGKPGETTGATENPDPHPLPHQNALRVLCKRGQRSTVCCNYI